MELVVLFNLLSSVRGVIRAELIDGDTARPLTGYSLNDSIPLIGHNALRAPLQWRRNGLGSAEQLGEGRVVRLRIEATFTKLFTFELFWQPAATPQPPPPPPVVTRAPTFDIDIIDATHGAYNHSYPSTPFANKMLGALSCQSQCDADPICKAWTYVEVSTPHSPERCCFAASIGCPKPSKGIVSGAKVTGPCTRLDQQR